jgi:protein-tyrosine phosphatase
MGRMGEKKEKRVSVLFVCHGNICRSPLAEGVFRHLAQQRGLSQRFEIDSAGVSSYHEGDPPDSRSAAVARQRGIELTGASRPLRAADLDRFDYVIVMDSPNLEAVERLARQTKPLSAVRLMREFDADADGDLNVPDPYYGGTRGFEDVHDIVERACSGLLDEIVRERGW